MSRVLESIKQKHFKRGYEKGRADERERCLNDINDIAGIIESNGEVTILKSQVIEAIKEDISK